MPDSVFFRIETESGVIVLTPLRPMYQVDSDVVSAELAQVRAQLADLGVSSVIIDFTELDFFNTNMLGALTTLWKKVRDRFGHLIVCNVSKHGLEVLRQTRLDSLWEVAATRQEAIDRICGTN